MKLLNGANYLVLTHADKTDEITVKEKNGYSELYINDSYVNVYTNLNELNLDVQKIQSFIDKKPYLHIKQTEYLVGKMQVVDFECEHIAFIDFNSVLEIKKHYYNDCFYGYNLYLLEKNEVILLETYENEETAQGVIEKIREALQLDVNYFIMPINE